MWFLLPATRHMNNNILLELYPPGMELPNIESIYLEWKKAVDPPASYQIYQYSAHCHSHHLTFNNIFLSPTYVHQKSILFSSINNLNYTFDFKMNILPYV